MRNIRGGFVLVDKVALNSAKQYRVVVRFYDSPKLKTPGPVSVTEVPSLRDLGVTSMEYVAGTTRLMKVVVRGSGRAIAKWLRQLKAAMLAIKQGVRAWDWRMSELTEVDMENLPV